MKLGEGLKKLDLRLGKHYIWGLEGFAWLLLLAMVSSLEMGAFWRVNAEGTNGGG
jgi:hypothetical protein